jgi:hypothetical protein
MRTGRQAQRWGTTRSDMVKARSMGRDAINAWVCDVAVAVDAECNTKSDRECVDR